MKHIKLAKTNKKKLNRKKLDWNYRHIKIWNLEPSPYIIKNEDETITFIKRVVKKYEDCLTERGKKAIEEYKRIHKKNKLRKFKYTINRTTEADVNKIYDFKTDYFYAASRKSAKYKALRELNKFKKDKTFVGVTVYDIEKTQDIAYYKKVA